MEAKRRPKRGPKGPKRSSVIIGPGANVVIPSAAHKPPRARVGRIMRGATCVDTVVLR